MNTSGKGREFEEYVAKIYELLLNLENENAILSKNVKIVKNGIEHQIDIYYEFTLANILHRVAIECKNWETPIHQKEFSTFESVIRHMNNVTGVIVSKSGYTQGAINYAAETGIKLLTLNDLPELHRLIGLNLQKVYIPRYDDPAEPFYALLTVDSNKNWDGSYLVDFHDKIGNVINLFVSKKHVEEFIRMRNERNIAVLPLKREHINFLVDLSIKGLDGLNDVKFTVITYTEIRKYMKSIALDAQDFKDEYLS